MLSAVCTAAVSASSIVIEPEYPTINAIFGTPVIDGAIDDIWNEAEIFYVDKAYSPDEATPDPICRFRVMYDETYLYFLTEVYDCTMGDLDWESLSVGGNLWKRDSVSFAFDPAYDRSETGFAEPSFWFIIGAYGHTANWQNTPQATFISEDELASYMYSISYVKDYQGAQIGYIIENKVNLKVRYPSFQAIDTVKIGFSMACNDNNVLLFSAGRNELMLLTTADGINHNNSEKATILLRDAMTSFSHSPAELRFPTPEGVYLEGEEIPTEAPTEAPTAAPTEAPTAAPTAAPTDAPTDPADQPTEAPTGSEDPTKGDDPTAAPETKASDDDGKGCGSLVAAAYVAVVAVIASVGSAVLRKKEN